jgi:NitT/TauT family transport system substrate-binding protein
MLSRAGLLRIGGAALASLSVRGIAQAAPATIRLGAVAVDSYAEPFYAQATGAFARANLAVDLTTFRSSGPMAAAAAGGAIDVGMTDISVIANAVGHGLPFVAIAGGGLYSSDEPTTMLCVAANAPYRHAKDFEGKAVAVSSLSSLSSTGVAAWLVRNGAELDNVRLIEIAPPEMAAALERGAVAGALIAEPVLTAAVTSGARPLANVYDAISPRLALNNWFTTTAWLERNPEAARRLVRCIYDVATWANAHRDQSGAILSRVARIDASTVRRMHRAMYATSLDVAVLQPVLDAAFTFKTIGRRVNAAALIASLPA